MARVAQLHSWDVTVPEARELQVALRERLVARAPSDFVPRLVAGADVAFDKARNLAFASAVIIELDSLDTVEAERDCPSLSIYL